MEINEAIERMKAIQEGGQELTTAVRRRSSWSNLYHLPLRGLLLRKEEMVGLKVPS